MLRLCDAVVFHIYSTNNAESESRDFFVFSLSDSGWIAIQSYSNKEIYRTLTNEADVSDVLEQLFARRSRPEFGTQLAGVGSADVGDHTVNGVGHGVDGIHYRARNGSIDSVVVHPSKQT